MDTVRVIIADDHPIFRDGVVRTLQESQTITVVDAVSDAPAALESVTEHMPDVILLDVNMPGDGLTAASKISACCPIVKIIILTSSEDEDTVHKGLSNGASGYVLKGVSGSELIDIVERVADGESYITPSLAAALLRPSNTASASRQSLQNELTAREQDILRQLSSGLSNKQIADNLNMAERTVKHHMTNILSKLHLKNRVEAALFAQKNFN